MTTRYRIAEDDWNDPPWRGAVGIESIEDEACVPAIVCWFTRGSEDMAQLVVRLLNDASL